MSALGERASAWLLFHLPKRLSIIWLHSHHCVAISSKIKGSRVETSYTSTIIDMTPKKHLCCPQMENVFR